MRMGVCVGFIQNLIGPRGQRRAAGGVSVNVVDVKEGCLACWLAAELEGFIDQVPSCSPDCWGPGCSRGGSDRGRSFWRRARPAKSGRLRYVVCSLHNRRWSLPGWPGYLLSWTVAWSGLFRPFHVAALRDQGKTLRASMQTSNRLGPINPSSSLQSQTLSQLYLPRPRRHRLTNEIKNGCLMPGRPQRWCRSLVHACSLACLN